MGKGIIATLGFCMFFAALVILAVQVIWYLWAGEWVPFTVIDASQRLFNPYTAPWFFSPQSWIGVYNALVWLPCSLACFFLGCFLLKAAD